MNMKRLAALIVALLIALAQCAVLAEEPTAVPSVTEVPTQASSEKTEETDDNPVLAVVGDEEITLYDAEEVAYMLYTYGYVSEYPDYDAAVDYLVQLKVVDSFIKSAGYDQLDEAEMQAFSNEANAEWEALLNDYVENYLTEDTEEMRTVLREQGDVYYASLGYSESVILEQLVMQEAYERLDEELLAGYQPTDEDIESVFTEVGAQYQAQYEGNVALYEYYTQYMGYESWYVPEGYRAVTHILLEVDDTVLETYLAAQSAYEEAMSAETSDEEVIASAKKVMEDTLAQVLESRQAEIDDIYARLEKGEEFSTLIAEYGADPGMQDDAMLASGYRVHAESIMYDEAFTAGAFQERMTAPGTYSEPVVGQFGIHIVYYLADVPGGLIMTDDIRTEISDYLLSVKLSKEYGVRYPEWEAGAGVTVYQEAIDAAKAAMADTDAE